MKRIAITVLGGLLMCVFASPNVWAQATAQISGTATDATGALLPGVEITATQIETGISRTAVTNETGAYNFPNLPLGPFQVEAVLPGFQTFLRSGLVLQVNADLVIDAVMEVGQVSQTIEVTANAALVETRSTALGTIIENERILELPLNGRNVQDLIELAGGAVNQGAGRGVSLVGGQSDQISVGGGAGFGVDYSLDGANHNSFITGSTMLMPFPDAMQEFTVERSGVTADRGSSTAVAAVTKSGTNEFHGNLFEFARNDLFNARSYFSTSESTLKRHQFGGTIGGPILENQLFFFGGVQRTTLRADPRATRATVPTADMLAGDWTTFASSACGGRSGRGFTNDMIDPANFSTVAVNMVNLPTFPQPVDECGNITYSGSVDSDNENFYVGRMDFQTSDSHSLFGRILIQDFAENQPVTQNFLQATGWRESMQQSYTVGSTVLLGGTGVHSFRFSYNVTENNYLQPENGTSWCDLGSAIYCEPQISAINRLVVSGGFGVSNGFDNGWQYRGFSYGINDDVSFIRGAHQFGFGGSFNYGDQANTNITWASQHQFRFGRLADFMTGRVQRLFTGQTNDHIVKGKDFALYVTDTWSATPSVNISAGLRWEPMVAPNVKAIYNFDIERLRAGIRTSQFDNAPTGFYYRGDPGFPENGINNRWGQFAPRLGLAWDVFGDGRTSMRTSYSLSFIDYPGDFREGFSGGAPWGSRINVPFGAQLDDPYAHVPGGSTFPYEVNNSAPFPPNGLYFTQPYDTKQPYTQAWNLSLERQVAEDWLVSAAYTGNNIMHVWGNKGVNDAVFFPGVANAAGTCSAEGFTLSAAPGATCSTRGNTTARRRLTLEQPNDTFRKVGNLAETDDGGVQSYHGMIVSVRRRAANGINLNLNYTWSHCIGPYATLWGPMSMHPDDVYTDPNNRDFDQGDCDSDRRHLFNSTLSAETPEFANRTLRLLASGWRLSGIYKIAAGEPLNINTGADIALNGLDDADNQRPNQITENPYGGSDPGDNYFVKSAFANPAPGTLGTMRRNSVVGWNRWDFDLALARIFRFGESQSLEFRVEAYNVTNSFRPERPGGFGAGAFTDITNRNFGRIRNAESPRILQFALKYAF